MSIINRGQLYETGGQTAIDLAPFGPLRVESQPVYQGSYEAIYNPLLSSRGSVETIPQGIISHRLDVSFQWIASSAAQGLLDRQTIKAFLYPPALAGLARTVELCEWADSDEVIKRTWRGCKCIGWRDPQPVRNTVRHMEFGFTLYSPYKSEFAKYSDGAQPTSHAYENYLFTDGTLGSAVPPTGSVTINQTTPAWSVSGLFSGLISAATGSGNVNSRQFVWIPSVDVTLTAPQISMATPILGGGATVMRLSSTAYTSSGDGIDLTLAGGATSASPAAGSFDVDAGDPVYFYVTTGAGGHQNVWFSFLAAERAA